MNKLSVVTAISFFVLSGFNPSSQARSSTVDAVASPADVRWPVDMAEQKLLQTAALIEDEDWAAASRQAQALVTAFPRFKLAELLQTLIASKSPLPETRPLPLQPEDDEFLPRNLEAELTLRRDSLHDKNRRGYLPGNILQLAGNVQYVFVVELEKSRLYVVKNDGGDAGVIADYYAGIGKQGFGKQREGDHRTPVGVYTVVDYLPDDRLPELYGIGALPLNYPNIWDKLSGRTGGGIWLHGVPRTTYSRAPRSSRGCITLSNRLFEALRGHATPGNTVVITTPSIEWREAGASEPIGKEINETLEQWRKDWSGLDFDKYISHYAGDFRTASDNYQSWARHKRRVNSRKQFIEVTLKDVSIFRYPGQENLVQVNYRQQYNSNNYRSDADKTQFWRKNGDGRWQIVYEGSRQNF
jgi:murein L,D-transpeptidase YafK